MPIQNAMQAAISDIENFPEVMLRLDEFDAQTLGLSVDSATLKRYFFGPLHHVSAEIANIDDSVLFAFVDRSVSEHRKKLQTAITIAETIERTAQIRASRNDETLP
ncbi:hypothetical protein [Tateyamaria sp.]|uniref:hypothetical protein n=1 Tax=Tateyamaria sp. TaxID=1929288 RepID=UPI003B225413